jgi:hypothetical protein
MINLEARPSETLAPADAANDVVIEALRIRRGTHLVLDGLDLTVRAGATSRACSARRPRRWTTCWQRSTWSARPGYGATLAGYAVAVLGFTLLALVLGALTLRRRTA